MSSKSSAWPLWTRATTSSSVSIGSFLRRRTISPPAWRSAGSVDGIQPAEETVLLAAGPGGEEERRLGLVTGGIAESDGPETVYGNQPSVWSGGGAPER